MDLDEQELRATRKMHGLDYEDEEEDNKEKEKKEEKEVLEIEDRKENK